MENVFKNLGYQVSLHPDEYQKKITVLSIKNTDGTLRWIWNAKNVNPVFLKFYSTSSFSSLLTAALIRLVFFMKLQHILFKKAKLYYDDPIIAPICNLQEEWALFTGTAGPNNKLILYYQKYFYKIANSETSRQLIQQEWEILKTLPAGKFYEIPMASLLNDRVLRTSDICKKQNQTAALGVLHMKALKELDSFFSGKIKIGEWKLLKDLKKQFYETQDKRFPPNFFQKIKDILNSLPEQEEISLRFSHGDFTAWNTNIGNEKLGIYDWELAAFNRPQGFDYFHFIIQNNILIGKKCWKEIYREIMIKNNSVFNFEIETLHKYLKLYLLINILQHINIYSEQEKWHQQVYWLLSVWNESLNTFLEDQYSHRKLIILDLFSRINHEEYAALKFPDRSPEKLPEYSDIDLICSKSVAQDLYSYFSHHIYTHKIILEKKSFLTHIKIITKDYEILSIDCIHQLKWKNIQILDAKKLISNSYINNFGIKNVSEEDTAKYILLFYKLNKSDVPKKHNSIININFNQTSENNVDKVLFGPLYNDEKVIIKALKKEKSNKGLSYFLNTIHYFMDLFSGKGFIITLSGVDGAGKSTVISDLSLIIEKKLRKPSVILRHRPSFLPILSVWTKGKEKAHKEVIESLPRQGKNRNFLASLFRFGYYYTDYLLGQFIIYFKYILRGYVVIYDRYYFDFIVDGKRSNIILPEKLFRAGYFFLLKPDYNVFLYEDSQVILQRKKELSKDTIEFLTQEYKNLFEGLAERKRKNIYTSLKNSDLPTTLQTLTHMILTTQ